MFEIVSIGHLEFFFLQNGKACLIDIVTFCQHYVQIFIKNNICGFFFLKKEKKALVVRDLSLSLV